MTIRKLIYGSLYLVTPGWYLTRWLRKRKACQKCSETSNLHLHHLGYPFFNVWYRLFWLSILIWIFSEYGMWLFVVLMIVPDLISRMKTLCADCHRRAHGKDK